MNIVFAMTWLKNLMDAQVLKVINRKCITLEQALQIYDTNPYPKEIYAIILGIIVI